MVIYLGPGSGYPLVYYTFSILRILLDPILLNPTDEIKCFILRGFYTRYTYNHVLMGGIYSANDRHLERQAK